MERIGIAANRMAKGNLLLYNGYVVLIAFMFSLFIFILSAAMVFFTVIILAYLGRELKVFEFERNWSSIFSTCIVSLSIIMSFFSLIAIAKNLKLHKGHS